MDDARATYCFCGCGARVTHPRRVVTNTNGWELSAELAEWAKLQILWSRIGRPLSPQFEKNMEDGEYLWGQLVAAVHTGDGADRQEEARAVVWRKHAKKDRRKLRRQFRRDG